MPVESVRRLARIVPTPSKQRGSRRSHELRAEGGRGLPARGVARDVAGRAVHTFALGAAAGDGAEPCDLEGSAVVRSRGLPAVPLEADRTPRGRPFATTGRGNPGPVVVRYHGRGCPPPGGSSRACDSRLTVGHGASGRFASNGGGSSVSEGLKLSMNTPPSHDCRDQSSRRRVHSSSDASSAYPVRSISPCPMPWRHW